MSNYPNIQAVIDGTVSGHATEWPQLRLELIQLRKEKADEQQLRVKYQNIIYGVVNRLDALQTEEYRSGEKSPVDDVLPTIDKLRTELDKMKPVYDDAVFLAEPTMLLSLSRYTNNGASVVNTVAIERLANAVRVSMEVRRLDQHGATLR